MTPPRISAAFVVSDFDGDPEQVTRAFGIVPTDVWRLGDATTLPGINKKSAGWRLRSPLEESLDLDPHIRWLLDRLYHTEPTLRQYERWTCEFSCSVVIVDETPSIALPAEVLDGIARLGADLDIDLILTQA